MADPTLTRVWDSLVTALEGITTADGYRTSVQTVTRDLVSIATLPAPKVPALLILHDGETSTRTYRLGGVVEDTLAFIVEGRIDAPGLTAGDKAHAYADLLADIERAVTRDVTRGAAANWTAVRGVRGPYFGLDASGVVLFQVRIEVVSIRTVGES